jgi:hypothetical protein
VLPISSAKNARAFRFGSSDLPERQVIEVNRILRVVRYLTEMAPDRFNNFWKD